MTLDTALEATRDRRAKPIDHATHQARLAQRPLYRLRTKEGEDHNGTRSDTRTLVQLLPTRLADVAEAEALAVGNPAREAAALRMAATEPNACDPKICNGSSISIHRETLARHRQPLVYGRLKHTAVYRAQTKSSATSRSSRLQMPRR